MISMPGSDISIIICTHNRASLLNDTFSSLLNICMPDRIKAEVVVVDNGSVDDTASVIRKFKGNGKFRVKALFEERLGKSYALNRAIHEASHDILAFIDDDHIVSEGYLKAVADGARERNEFGLYCGRILPNWDGTEPAWVHDDRKFPIRPYPVPQFDLGCDVLEVNPDKGMFIPGAGNLMVRKSVFERIGLFSEELGPRGHNLMGGEDIEFVRRALREGERLLYIPAALQYHQVDNSKLTLSYMTRKAYLRSMASCQFADRKEIKYSFRIPAYLFRQALTRLAKVIFSLSRDARRYYLIRLAASIGEINGYRKRSSINE